MGKYCRIKSKFHKVLWVIGVVISLLLLAAVLWFALPRIVDFDIRATMGYLTNPSGTIFGINGSEPAATAFGIDGFMCDFLIYGIYMFAMGMIVFIAKHVFHAGKWTETSKGDEPMTFADNLFLYPIFLIVMSAIARFVIYSIISLSLMYKVVEPIVIVGWIVGFVIVAVIGAYGIIWVLCEVEKGEEKKGLSSHAISETN